MEDEDEMRGDAAAAMDNESASAKKWLEWCKSHKYVKCTESEVPLGILPSNYQGTLIDVKVQGPKRFGPDDKIYAKHEELREKVARGNCVLELRRTDLGSMVYTTYHFLVFALKKFSGGMGDEDNFPCEQNAWQTYFMKPLSSADRIVSTVKANGEAAHVSCRRLLHQDYFCFGSKNVHLLARDLLDVERYNESRYMIAKIAAVTFLSTYMLESSISADNKKSFVKYLQKTKYTCVLELLQPTYQHIESLSHLKRPELRFICWTTYTGDNKDSLCVMPPNAAITQAKSFQLRTTDFEFISAASIDDYMDQIRAEKGYEGRVLYFLDKDDNVFGVLKKKTAWYIILRAIREKACGLFSSKSSVSVSDVESKVEKRIAEIQTWTGFSDTSKRHWIELGRGFIRWASKINKSEGIKMRPQFPEMWERFLNHGENEKYKTLYNNLQF